MFSSAGIVSREWAAIQSTASSSETNFPKWWTEPFRHTICTRQILPSRTGNRTVLSVPIKPSPCGRDQASCVWLVASVHRSFLDAPERRASTIEAESAGSMCDTPQALHFKAVKVGQVAKSRRYSSEPHDLSAGWAMRRAHLSESS